ncbi:MAG: NUDIX domain-containing protein [Mariprofundaceae bacterium]|nr:NUDIX domain-containing protein [Mariprofundaceae bacterium]
MNTLSSMPNTEAKEVQLIVLIACFNLKQDMLLLKRKPDAHGAGLWSLPGGKVDADEMPLQAAVRELKEETGLQGKRWRHLGKTSYVYEQCSLQFIIFVCQCDDALNFKPESEPIWIKREQLHDYPMPKANEKIIAMLNMPEIDNYLKGTS